MDAQEWLNEQGFRRAQATGRLDLQGSAILATSDPFSIKNQNADFEQYAAQQDKQLALYAAEGIRPLRAGVMAAFGCNYTGDVQGSQVIRCIDRLLELAAKNGVTYEYVSLADTMGWATPATVKRIVGAVRERWPELELALHLHDTRGMGVANAYAGLGVGLVPEDSALAADRELRAYQRDNPEHRSHVLTSAWHVPVRWFSAFRTDDRELYEKDGRIRARFRVGMLEARRRVGDVLEVLKGLEVFDSPADEQTQLLAWLGQFPDESMLELDYDEVSELFEAQELALDDSVELIQASVEALAAGDMMRAGENYGRVVARWSHAFSLTFSS